MDAFRAYLAWQAELGGDEVMVASPLSVHPSAGRTVPRPDAAQAAARGMQIRDAANPHADAMGAVAEPSSAPSGDATSLFSMLSKSLQDSQDSAKAARRFSGPTAPAGSRDVQSASPAAAATLAAAADKPDILLPGEGGLAACREYLERNGRSLFTGDVQDAAWKYVHGTGPESAPLALVSLEASAADGLAGIPFQGPSGLLLEKMMRAIRLDLSALYRTAVVKLPPPGAGRRCYTRRDLVKLLPLLHAELEASKAPVVLLLGEACAQAVLKTGRGLEELRLAPHRVDVAPGREFAVTYHPDELEGNEDLKRKAWKDLQWLQARLQGS